MDGHWQVVIVDDFFPCYSATHGLAFAVGRRNQVTDRFHVVFLRFRMAVKSLRLFFFFFLLQELFTTGQFFLYCEINSKKFLE